MASPTSQGNNVPAKADVTKLVLLRNTSSIKNARYQNVMKKNTKHEQFKARKAKEKANRNLQQQQQQQQQPKVLVLGANVSPSQKPPPPTKAEIAIANLPPNAHPSNLLNPNYPGYDPETAAEIRRLGLVHKNSAPSLEKKTEIAIANLPPNAHPSNLLNPNYPGYDPEIAAEIRRMGLVNKNSAPSLDVSPSQKPPPAPPTKAEIAIANLPQRQKSNLLNPNYPGYDPEIAAEIRRLGLVNKKEAPSLEKLKGKKKLALEEVRMDTRNEVAANGAGGFSRK
jgi:hypothetical protein